MVRTKKQIIDSIAVKNKQHDPKLDNPIHRQFISPISEFHAPNVPVSPLPTSLTYPEEAPIHLYYPAVVSTIPIMRSNPYFEPPQYMANNLWPPLPQSSIQNVLTAGVCGKKLESTFSNLNQQEIRELMIDCKGNEDEAILRLITQTGYLEYIRHRVSLSNRKIADVQKFALPQILPQRSIQPQNPTLKIPLPLPQNVIPQHLEEQRTKNTPNEVTVESPLEIKSKNVLTTHATAVSTAPSYPDVKSSTPYKTHKRHRRPCRKVSENSSGACNTVGSGGRLTLDDALQQIQDSKNNGETDGYAGWSAARLRAFKMIDKNPNSYYYRFNAPGEQQKKGKWTEEENALFLKRLKQVGANSQWGIFSIAIPGRVGYQCSNYYRFMIEMGQLHDPNYVLDEKGKARYLFDKKTEGGTVEKIFRKHSKHGSAPAKDLNVLHTSKKKREQSWLEEDDDDDPTFTMKKSVKKKAAKSASTDSRRHDGIRRSTRRGIQPEKDGDCVEQQADHVVPN